jgi:hypothetical protein
MRLTILFWNFNIQKGNLMRREPDNAARAAVLARVARHHDIDILALCECEIAEDEILNALRAEDTRYDQPANPHERFQFFTRFPGDELEAFHADGRLAVRRFHRAGYKDILLAAFHFIDGWNNTAERQHDELDTYKQTLVEAEERAGHTRTVLFGDLNMDPFAIGMLEPRRGLGALMTWELAEAHCEVDQKGPPRFYNPMWSVMGQPDAPGTYYWDKSDPKNPYWHCIDGVLLRPCLRGIFKDDSLRILSRIPGSAGAEIALYHHAEKHCHIDYSDHLPIVFGLDLPKDQEEHDARPR